MLRAPTPLSDELEDLVRRTIGCCITVHRALGPGLLESIYSRAVCIELDHSAIAYEREKLIPVMYREQLLCSQRIDIVVENQIVLSNACTPSIKRKFLPTFAYRNCGWPS